MHLSDVWVSIWPMADAFEYAFDGDAFDWCIWMFLTDAAYDQLYLTDALTDAFVCIWLKHCLHLTDAFDWHDYELKWCIELSDAFS